MGKQNDDELLEVDTSLRYEEIPWFPATLDGMPDTGECAYCGRHIKVGEQMLIIKQRDQPLMAMFCETCEKMFFKEVT